MWRDWFTFTKQDRRAIIMLAIAITIVWGLLYFRSTRTGGTLFSEGTDSIAASLNASPKSEQPIVRIDRHNFNPNEADSLELLTLGLSPRVTSNILRYRRAGGQFRRAEDLSRIYGMHDTVFTQIKPFITIPQQQEKKTFTASAKSPKRDTTYTRPKAQHKEHPYAAYMSAKLKPGETVDINSADTTELMRIPGIGPVYAKMIVDYRRQLGGFYDLTQLSDLETLPHQLNEWVRIDNAPTEKLCINKLSVTQLRSHPYLNFYQAKAIVELRRREGNIKSTRQLLFLDEFTEADIKRLMPYLSFE